MFDAQMLHPTPRGRFKRCQMGSIECLRPGLIKSYQKTEYADPRLLEEVGDLKED
jgi:hypothetical protein